jgi:hypothetical protein
MSIVTFLQHPRQSLKDKRRAFIYRCVSGWGRHRIDRAGVLPEYEAYRVARPARAWPPQYADLWFLYRMIRRRRPAVVWEFGSGNSTVIIARALVDNGTGFLYSMDGEAEWADATRRALPERLRRVCMVRHAPFEAIAYDGHRACRHVGLPDQPPNFAYLDSGWVPTVDLLLVESCLPPDFYLVIDDRQRDTAFLLEHFRRRYRFSRRRLVRQQMFELVA